MEDLIKWIKEQYKNNSEQEIIDLLYSMVKNNIAYSGINGWKKREEHFKQRVEDEANFKIKELPKFELKIINDSKNKLTLEKLDEMIDMCDNLPGKDIGIISEKDLSYFKKIMFGEKDGKR